MTTRREFLEAGMAAGTVAGLAAVPRRSEAAEPSDGFVQVAGLGFRRGGRPVRLRGVNLGNWMLIEDYMIGLPWTEWKIRERFRTVLGEEAYRRFFGAYAEVYVAEADLAFLARSGFTFVRLPLNYRHFESDLEPGRWLEDGFRQLDRAVARCRKHGLLVLLDLHAAPGAQARDQNAGSAYGEAYLWLHRDFMDRTATLWREIARRYHDEPAVLGYNVLCEPVLDDRDLFHAFNLKVQRAIREVDTRHVVAFDANRWAREVSSLRDELFLDPQTVPALHHYYFDDPALSRVPEYPGTVDGVRCDRARVEKGLDGKFDQKRIPRPVLAAEFGVTRAFPQPWKTQLAITRELVSVFEERGWPWALWCYKDLRDMGIVTVKPDAPWRRFVEGEEIASLRKRYEELQKPFAEGVGKLLAGTDVEADTREQWAREVARDFDPPMLDFVLRRLKPLPLDELEAMARSFAFESCRVDEELLAALA
jgi:endoglucanase